jgi:hypothetical protein
MKDVKGVGLFPREKGSTPTRPLLLLLLRLQKLHLKLWLLQRLLLLHRKLLRLQRLRLLHLGRLLQQWLRLQHLLPLLLHLRLLPLPLRLVRSRPRLLLRQRLLAAERALRLGTVLDHSDSISATIPLICMLRLEFAAEIASAYHVGRAILPSLHCPRQGRGPLSEGPRPILGLSLLPAIGLPGRELLLL